MILLRVQLIHLLSMMESAHLNAALHSLLQSTLWMQHPGWSQALVCNQVLYSIGHEKALLNGGSSPLQEVARRNTREFIISPCLGAMANN